MIEKILLVVVALFPISEIVLAVMKRSRGGRAQSEDRGSMRLLWLSIVGLLVPIGLGVLNRIDKEEQALLAGLGSPYESYCARTKRLFPGLY